MTKTIITLFLIFWGATTFAQQQMVHCEVDLKDTNNLHYVQPHLAGAKIINRKEVSKDSLKKCIGIIIPCMFFADAMGYRPDIQGFNYSFRRKDSVLYQGSCKGPLFDSAYYHGLKLLRNGDMYIIDSVQSKFYAPQSGKTMEKNQYLTILPLSIKVIPSIIKSMPTKSAPHSTPKPNPKKK